MKTKASELSRICLEIEKQGWSSSDHLLTTTVSEGLELQLKALEEESRLRPAKIGRAADEHRQESARGDLIAWFDDANLQPMEKLFIDEIRALEEILQQRLFLPLHQREFHYALYPAGAHYEKHVDQHRGSSQRQISCVHYLNRDWKTVDGGRLRIFKEDSPLDVDAEIDPIFGRSVFFLSDRIAHEVLVSHQPRRSVTGWLRR